MKEPIEFAKEIAYSTYETLMFSHACAEALQDTEGVYVECGVAAGAQIIAMAVGAPNKIIHAFDSFKGIPLPSNKDNQIPGIRSFKKDERSTLPDPGQQEMVSSGVTVVPLKTFKENIARLQHPQNIVIHEGWFEDTVAKADIDKIAILRLDGDLYNSTRVCLQALFHKVIKGGIVIIDDYQLPGCRLACREFFREIDYRPDYVPVSNIMYFIK